MDCKDIAESIANRNLSGANIECNLFVLNNSDIQPRWVTQAGPVQWVPEGCINAWLTIQLLFLMGAAGHYPVFGR